MSDVNNQPKDGNLSKSLQMETTSPIQPQKKDGILIFSAAIFGGWLGLHCFMSKRYLRGLVYFLMGGIPWGFVKGLQHNVCPVWYYMLGFSLRFVQMICNTIDVYKISRGKYTDKPGRIIYGGGAWMALMFVLYVFLYYRSFFTEVYWFLRKMVEVYSK